jgi:large subunit ribosomal protein L35
MGKLKTHKGLKKRVRVTARGKVMRGKAGRRHLLSHKSGKRTRQLRRKSQVAKAQLNRAKAALGER